MKLLWVLAPILALALYVAGRTLSGRPLSRFALSALTALCLLVYVAITGALGIFWVARMDLPAFDWHYLFGYCVMLLVTVHVTLELPVLIPFVRRAFRRAGAKPGAAPKMQGARFRLDVVSLVIGLLLGAAAMALLGKALGPERPAVPEAVSRSGLDAVRYLYEQSAYSQSRVARAPRFAASRPGEFKDYPGRHRVTLPTPPPPAGIELGSLLNDRSAASPGGAGAAAQVQLSGLLHYAGGITSRKAEAAGLLLRAAASSGALYPTDLYVVDSRLGSGAYYYDPRGHDLVQSSAQSGLEAELRGALPQDSPLRQAESLIVLSAMFDRTVFKYGARSYRYVALDAGHIAANLELTGTALGAPCELEPSFDDERVTRALGLDAEHEGPLLVAGCGKPSQRTAPVVPAHAPASMPANAEDLELTRLSHRLTSYRLLAGEARSLTSPPSEQLDLTKSLPTPAPAARDLFETISNRRSYREFSKQALSSESLGGVLADARRGLPPLRSADWIELFLAVRAVEGIAAGVYRYDAGRHGLVLQRSGDVSAQVQSAGLSQELLGRAAAVLIWTFRDSRVGLAEGARDFRIVNLDIGRAGEVAYLSATARGLGICGVGAFYDEEIENLLRASEGTAEHFRPLYLMGVGL